ncbi:DDE-type integrase/transposase/recombinase, partial [Paracoccus fontiphilus]
MKAMGLQGVVRGRKVITTNPDTAQPCPDDKVNRAFVADMPNQLWVSDFTYVSSWQGPRHGLSDQWRSHGSIHVAIRRENSPLDCFLTLLIYRRLCPKDRRWRVSTSMTTGFVLDALNQAICQRTPSETDKLIHHSDRGSQYLSIRYTERLAEAGIDTSVGSVGDSHDNALAESIIHFGAYAAPLGSRSPSYVQDRGHQVLRTLEVRRSGRMGNSEPKDRA